MLTKSRADPAATEAAEIAKASVDKALALEADDPEGAYARFSPAYMSWEGCKVTVATGMLSAIMSQYVRRMYIRQGPQGLALMCSFL